MGRPAAETISLKEFARDWNVHVRTVTNWLAEGMPCRTVNGTRRVVRADANEWVRARAAEAAEEQAEPANSDEAERRYQLARAEKIELEVRRARGELVSVEEAAAPIEAMLEQLRAQLVTVPQRWAPALLACKGLPEMTAKLDAMVVELMTTLASEPEEPEEEEAA